MTSHMQCTDPPGIPGTRTATLAPADASRGPFLALSVGLVLPFFMKT